MNNNIKYKIIDTLKTESAFIPIYNKLKKSVSGSSFSLSSINRFTLIKNENEEKRLNLVLPTLRKTKVFGGISTAIKIFLLLVKKCNTDGRIIILNDESNDLKWQYSVEGFSSENSKKQIYNLYRNPNLQVRKNDVFIFTNWRTAYTLNSVIEWHKEQYGDNNYKSIYLIQDFEPGFFAWSTQFELARTTYIKDSNSIIALFNSSFLCDYFINHGYSFAKEVSFNPSLNEELKKELLSYKRSYIRNSCRRKRILIYGRPSEPRNAFEIIRYALELWSEQYIYAKEWEIISLGESFDDIKLANNTIKSYGKVSLHSYAHIMLSSYAGISLMISPHPSYPPLEMATFGIKTITNKFENKDLKDFNKYIYSLDMCDPDVIKEKLIDICNGYSIENSNPLDINEDYINDNSLIAAVNTISSCIWF